MKVDLIVRSLKRGQLKHTNRYVRIEKELFHCASAARNGKRLGKNKLQFNDSQQTFHRANQ